MTGSAQKQASAAILAASQPALPPADGGGGGSFPAAGAQAQHRQRLTMFSRRSMADLMFSRLRGPTSVLRVDPDARAVSGGGAAEMPGRAKAGWVGRLGAPRPTELPSCRAAQCRAAQDACIPPAGQRSLMDTEVEPQVPQPRVREGSRWKSAQWGGIGGGQRVVVSACSHRHQECGEANGVREGVQMEVCGALREASGSGQPYGCMRQHAACARHFKGPNSL